MSKDSPRCEEQNDVFFILLRSIFVEMQAKVLVLAFSLG